MEEYFVVTFDEYDDLEEKAIHACITKDHEFPTRHQIRLMEKNEETLYQLLVAMHHAKDMDYIRFLNEYFKATIKFAEDSQEKEMLKQKLQEKEQSTFSIMPQKKEVLCSEEYFIVTFDEYDDLEEKAVHAYIPEDYEVPTRHQIRVMEKDKTTLYQLLVAMYYTKDKDYIRFLNEYLKATVKFAEDSQEREILKQELQEKIQEKIQEQEQKEQLMFPVTPQMSGYMKTLLSRIHFSPVEYYPTKEDIQKIIKRYYKDDKESVIAYLLWLYSSDIELSKEEKKTREYIKVVLNQLIVEK